jgi:steroid delta-isomerase-like uncharacterized protein
MGQALATVEQFYREFASGDLDAAMGLFAADCVTITPAGDLPREAHRAFSEAFRSALPDAHMVVERSVEAGDELSIVGRFRGTHRGDLVGPDGAIPASGNTIDVPFMEYWRVERGRIVNHEVIWDQLGMLTQLGAMPPG